MPTVSLYVFMSCPSIVWTGLTISSSHLSMERGHCLIVVSGLPIMTKIASISVANFINICSLECPRRSVPSTYMRARSFLSTPLALTTLMLILHATAEVMGVLGLRSAQPIISTYFLFLTGLPLWGHICATSFLSFLKKSYLCQFLDAQKSEDMKN